MVESIIMVHLYYNLLLMDYVGFLANSVVIFIFIDFVL